jgi:tetratricopeptide (TPR) repeat protein
MGRPPLSINVTPKDQKELAKLLSGGVQQVRVVVRALALLQLARGTSAPRISQVVPLTPQAIWHTRPSNIGSALLRLGRIDEDIRHQQKATELHPTVALAWDTLARGYLSCGRQADALNTSRRAFELAPKSISIVTG